MLDGYGVTATGQRINRDQTALECPVIASDNFCRASGSQAKVQGRLVWKVTHVLIGWRPTHWHVRLPRYRCDDYWARVWQQDIASVVESEPNLSHAVAL